MLKNTALVVLSLLFFIVVTEYFLRITQIAAEWPWGEGDSLLGYRFLPNQTGTWVVGPFGNETTRYHINNHGWNTTRDYSEKRDPQTLRIAVIGDSYVEALNVPPEAALAAVLEHSLRRIAKVEVYPFGTSGASLSHYLAMMRYVRNRFSPDLYIINIIQNDFTESLPSPDRAVFHAVRPTLDSYEEVPPHPYEKNSLRRMLARLAIIRYLYLNLTVQRISFASKNPNKPQQFEANIDVATIDTSAIKGVVKYLFSKYLEEVEGDRKKLLLVVDTPRKRIYEGMHPQSSPAFQYNILTSQICRALSLYCLDLTNKFLADFQLHKKRFNSPIDGHWNAYGHQLVAKAIEDFLMRNALFPKEIKAKSLDDNRSGFNTETRRNLPAQRIVSRENS